MEAVLFTPTGEVLMEKQRNALFSVTDKDDLEVFKPLLNFGWRFISTGGTARYMEERGMPTTPVGEITDFPEMMDGRLKTLHPKIFGGILARRNNPEDMGAVQSHNIPLIDLVVVNLYDFPKEPGIENIDIGGPSLIRAAAKNYQHVVVLINPDNYEWVVKSFIEGDGPDFIERERLAADVFRYTHLYDEKVADWFLFEDESSW